MPIFALVGGAPPGGEQLLGCCALCPLLPLVAALSVIGVVRGSIRIAGLSLLMAAGPFLIALVMVTTYQPSTNEGVLEDQAAGWNAFVLHGSIMTGAALALGGVIQTRWEQESKKPIRQTEEAT